MIKNEKLIKCLKALKEDTYFKKFIEIAHGNDIVWGKLDECWDVKQINKNIHLY